MGTSDPSGTSVVGSCLLSPTNCSPVSLQTSGLRHYGKALTGSRRPRQRSGDEPRGNTNLGRSHRLYLCAPVREDSAVRAQPSCQAPCRNPHPGPRNTDLPAASRERFSTADPRLWRWSPAAARSATSGAARGLLRVGCSSQTRPHSAGQPGRRLGH